MAPESTTPPVATTAASSPRRWPELVRRADARASTGKALTSDAEVWVPPEIREEAVDLVRQASTLVHENAQPPRSTGTRHVNMTSVLFEMTGAEDDDDAAP
ncbi:MAG: hypothetical protein WKF73_22335 [Nocardioidaceae bacterium]